MPDSIDAGRVHLDVTFDGKQITKALTDPVGSAAKDVERQLGSRMQSVGKEWTRTLTPAFAAAALGFRKAFQEWDTGLDTLRAATGATGAELGRLGDSMKRVGGQVTAGLGQIGATMAEVQQRTGAAGAELELLTTRVLQLGAVGNAASVETLTRVFGDWSVATGQQADAMDRLFRASQVTGVPIERLGQLIVQYGAPLREFGYSIDEAAGLLGQMEQAGVNTELVMGALRVSLGKFARDQRDPQEALAATVTAIQDAGSAAEANAIAFETFGARAGVDMARAISEGRFNLDDLNSALATNHDTIAAAADDTVDLGDQLKMLANRAMGAVGPVSEIGFGISGMVAGIGPALSGLGKLRAKFGEMAKGAGGVGKAVGAAGSVLTGPWGLALAGAAVGLGIFMEHLSAARTRVQSLADVIVEAGGRLEDLPLQALVDRMGQDEIFQQFDQLGLSAADAAQAILDGGDAVATFQLRALELAQLYADGRMELPEGLTGSDMANAAAAVGVYMQNLSAEVGRSQIVAAAAAAAQAQLNSAMAIGGSSADALRGEMAAMRDVTGTAAARQHELAVAFEVTEAAMYANRVAAWNLKPAIDLSDQWAATLSAFHDPAGAYETAVQRIAQATADATSDTTDSWRDFADGITPTMADINAMYAEQQAAALNWGFNFARVAARIPEDVIPELERLGRESPEQLALLASASQEELAAWVGYARTAAPEFTGAIQSEIEQAAPDLALVTAAFGQGASDALASHLASGVLSAADIAWAYTEALRTGVNPLLLALGRAGIAPVPPNEVSAYVNRLDHAGLAEGGMVPGPDIRRDIVDAKLMPREWVINRGVSDRIGPWRMGLLNAGKATVVPFAAGGQVPDPREDVAAGGSGPLGFQVAGDVPGVPSFAPYSGMVGEPAIATAVAARAAALAFVALWGGGTRPALGSQGFGRGGGGGPGGAYTAGMMHAYEIAQSMGFTSIGGYRAKGSVKGSDHPKHRAWDFMLPGGQGHEEPGWRLATWHVGHSTDVGTKYLIFSDLINKGGGWYPYHHPSNPGDKNPTLAHRDHLHASYLAAGGIVTSPTLAVLGEKTREAVIPLDQAIPVNLVEVSGAAAAGIPTQGGLGPHSMPVLPLNLPGGSPVTGPANVNARAEEQAANQAAAALAALTGPALIAALNALQAETVEWSDEWVALQHDIDAATTDMQQQLQAAADDATRTLKAMLAERDRIAAQQAEATRQHRTAVAELDRQYATQQQAAIATRTQALDASLRLDQRIQETWGNTTRALTANLMEQAGAFADYRNLLFGLRARGLDAGLIAALGLDAGPQALGQIRALTSSTDAELAQLNAAYLARSGEVAATVQAESVSAATALGAQLLSLQDVYVASVEDLNERQVALMATLAAQMAAIGTDMGMSTAEAIAAGLTSGIPAIVDAAAAVAAALGAAAPVVLGVGGAPRATGTSGGKPGPPGRGQARTSPILPVHYDYAGADLAPKVSLHGVRMDLVLDNGQVLSGYVRSQADAAHAARAYRTMAQAVR